MSNNETTTKFKVDISELKKAMQDAKRSISVANSEFKAASSAMDDWSKSTDGISAKLKQLDSNLTNQKKILKSLEQQYKAVVAEEGESSAAADRLKVAINNQKATIKQTEKQISNYKATLSEVSEAEKTAAKTGKSVIEVLDEMGKEAEETEGGFTVLKGTLATFAGNMLTGFVGAIKDGVSNLMGLAEETREYRTELAKLDSGALQAGASTDYIKEKWKDMGTVLGDEGAVTEGLNNLLATGFTTEKEMDSITKSLEGAAIKWKDTLKFEGMADGLQETLATGSAVGQFGELLERSGVNLDSFNDGLGKCKTEAEKQNFVLDQLSKLGLAEVSDSYREQNKEIINANKANAEYTDKLAQLGEKVEPVTTSLRNGFNRLLGKILELIEDVDISVFTGAIQEGFAVLTDTVLPAVVDGFGWILDNKDTIMAGLAGIAAGFVAFKVASLITAVSNALKGMSVQTALAAAKQWLLNTALLANPIGLIVALIAGLVTAFVVLWKKSDSFREFWLNLWEKIKSATNKVVQAIGKFFTETVPNALENMITFFKALPNKIWTWLSNALSKVSTWASNMKNKAKDAALSFIDKVIEFVKQLPSKIWTWLVNVVSKVVEWRVNMLLKAKDVALSFINKIVEFISQLPNKIWTWLVNTANKVVSWGSSLASKGKEAAQKLLTSIINKVKEIPDKIKSIGADIVSGLWKGIGDKVSWLKNKISGFVGDVTDWLKKFFKIGSPSKLMRDEIGRWLPEGIALGVSDNAKSVINSMKNLALDTVGATRDNLGSSSLGYAGGVARGGVINNFTQVINSPKQLSRLDIYRQSKNLLNYAGGVS